MASVTDGIAAEIDDVNPIATEVCTTKKHLKIPVNLSDVKILMSIFFTTILCLYSTAMVFKIHRSVLALRGGGHTGFDPQRNGKHPLAA